MKKFLKICDLYGTQFHLFYNYKPKYYTCYGGIFSIITVLSWITIFLFFIMNDIKRNQSISNTSTLPPTDYKNIKFGKEKIYLPWRITDYDEKFINHKGIIFPKIYYFSNKFNNETGLMETNYNLINYKLCNETNMKNIQNNILLDIPINELYCIDMQDLNMGGTWNSEYINYIRLDLYLCEDGIDYNKTNNKCTSHDYLLDKIGKNNNWYFELLYPVIQFQPSVKKMPILVYYKTYYYGLSLNTNKLDRIYFQEHIIEDQQNWIYDISVNKSYWGTSSIKGDNYYIGKNDPVRFGSSSRLYSLKIYIDYGTIYYTRKYKKLFELLGEAFPIVNIISTILGFISVIINELKANKKLNEFIIFNNKELLKKNKNNNEYKENKKPINVIKLLNNLNIIEKNKQELYLNRKSFMLGDSSKLNCIHNDLTNNKIILKGKTELIPEKKNKKLFKTVNFSKHNSESFEYFKRDKNKFPIIYYFFGLCLNKISSKKNNNYMCISKKFHKVFKFYTHLVDITSYISLYKEFELFKTNILNEINSKENYKIEKKLYKTYKDKDKNNIIFTNILRAKSLELDNKNYQI